MVSFNGVFKVPTVSKILTFNIGEYFCDRFDFIYDLEFNNYNSQASNARCRVSPDQEAGLYGISLTSTYGNPVVDQFKSYSYDIANN